MNKVIKGMKVIPVEGKEKIEKGVVVIKDGKFQEVGVEGEIQIPSGSEVIELNSDLTVLPGLIDSHIHCLMDASGDPFKQLSENNDAYNVLQAAKNLNKALSAGITWVRDLGGKDYLEIGIKNGVENGLFKGPRMKIAGKTICMTGGHGYKTGREADGVSEVKKAAREQLKAGADVIKIMATGGVMTEGVEPGSPQLSREEIEAAVEEAHKAGRKAATHAQGTEGIKNAVLAEIDSVEHGIFLDDETIELMLEKDVFMVPTLAAPYWIIEAGEEKGVPEYAVKKSRDVMQSHQKSFKKALDAGVNIAFGTDAGTPFNLHGKNTFELKMMVEAGMTQMQAIESATIKSAELLDIEDKAGSITEGKIADMLIVKGDPSEDIEEIFNVEAVYKEGEKII
ncbi:MAG: amidohydrolase family protein [Halanaerobiales bacterium]